MSVDGPERGMAALRTSGSESGRRLATVIEVSEAVAVSPRLPSPALPTPLLADSKSEKMSRHGTNVVLMLDTGSSDRRVSKKKAVSETWGCVRFAEKIILLPAIYWVPFAPPIHT